MAAERYIVISYVPLLKTDPQLLIRSLEQQDTGTTIDVAIEISNALAQAPDVHVQACVWMHDIATNAFSPVLLMDNAAEVADHLVAWAENNPAAWFHAYMEQIDEERYIILLFPNLSKSIQRFKLNCIQAQEFIPQSDADYTMMFKPLEFVSQGTNLFPEVAPHLTDKISIGFLDTKDFDQQNPGESVEKIRYIGPLERVSKSDQDEHNSYISEYVKSHLENNE
jgi:hypothetical protein